MNHVLPPVPRTIRTPTDVELGALLQRNPSLPKTPVNCVTCHGTKHFKWYRYDGKQRIADDVVDYDCDCKGQFVMNRVFLNAGIGRNYQTKDLNDFLSLPPSVVEQVNQYLNNSSAYISAGFGLVLTGGRGTGKTLMSNLLIKSLVMAGANCYATTFSQLLDTFSGGWRDPAERQWFDQCMRNAGVLLVDDLGRERNLNKGKDGANDDSLAFNTLEAVIRHRVSNAMPTFITTNLRQEQVEQGYGGHTMSLLSESSMWIDFPGVDSRSVVAERLRLEIAAGITRPILYAA